MIVNQGNLCQATVSTGAVGIRTASGILRRLGYKVSASSMGSQVTSVGRINMTLLNIDKGTNGDTFGASEILRCHIPELR